MDSPYNSVCSKCIEDENITSFIEDHDGPVGCWFCGQDDAPTIPLDELADYMRDCLSNFYSLAIDELPYDSREGGYQGTTWDTTELLVDEGGIGFPRDDKFNLLYHLSNEIKDDVWCEYDWLVLDYSASLLFYWKQFCRLIQHKRRFFFFQQDEFTANDEDGFSPMTTLSEFSRLSRELGLYRAIKSGTVIFRARSFKPGREKWSAKALGPPPVEAAIQANRMSPPGISMMYVAETKKTAIREVGVNQAVVGQFELERDILVLDLVNLPSVPGLFSGRDRQETMELAFMNRFAREIGKPIDRDDRVHVEYIPSQVVTEFIRDTLVDGREVDGIRYRSSLDKDGINIVLFATQDNILKKNGKRVIKQSLFPEECWIRFIDSKLMAV